MDNSGRGCLSAVRVHETGNSPSSCACAHPKKKGERAIESEGRIHTPCLRARTLSPHSTATRSRHGRRYPLIIPSHALVRGPYEISLCRLQPGRIAVGPLLWKYLMKPYQKMRILSLFNPEADPTGYGYHAIQAKIAVGSGGFHGMGYLKGTQHRLHFIPEQHTDLIFAVFGEEWGLVGSVVLLLLFASFVYRCLKISKSASTRSAQPLLSASPQSFSFNSPSIS